MTEKTFFGQTRKIGKVEPKKGFVPKNEQYTTILRFLVLIFFLRKLTKIYLLCSKNRLTAKVDWIYLGGTFFPQIRVEQIISCGKQLNITKRPSIKVTLGNS